MMGHRHITTTERYLHYEPDSDGALKLTALWGSRESGAPKPSEGGQLILLRKAA